MLLTDEGEMNMNKYKNLVNNSVIFTVGLFGSKLLNLFMVPLYTNILSTAEYGTADLITVTSSLLIPYLTLELGQASLRFLKDEKYYAIRDKIFNNVNLHGLFSIIIIFFLAIIANFLDVDLTIIKLSIPLTITQVFVNLYSYYLKGAGLVREFAINGILTTAVTVISNLILLIGLDMKVSGYILSLVIAAIISIIYMLFTLRKTVNFLDFSVDFLLQKKMLRYSIPIVPNSTMWWIIGSSTRYFVLNYVGVSANGLYAVANRIPSLLSVLTNIFNQAWQLSSFEEYKSEDTSEFYSNIFNFYSFILYVSSSIILIILKPLMSVYVEQTYFESWTIIPFLLLSVIFQSFAAFLGTVYTASGKTKGVLKTAIFGAVSSLVFNFLIIPQFGLIGAGIATALSFLIMFLYRAYDTKKIVRVDIEWPIFLANNIVILIQTFLLFKLSGTALLFSQIVISMSLLIINIKYIKLIMKILCKFFRP